MRLMLAVLMAAGVCAAAEWRVVKKFAIGGAGAWDYITVDAQTHRLYVPRTTHTQVIDAESGRILGDIPGQKNAHGVALAPRAGRGFISDGGGDGSIVVFDLKTYGILGKLPAVEDVDGIIFDDTSGRVLAVSGRGKRLMSFKPDIDLKTGNMDEPVELRGEPEFLAADAAGKVYINLKDTNEVAVVDLQTRKIVAHWPVAPGGSPVGMALDAKAGRLFIGCRAPQKLVAMSTRDGKVVADLAIGANVDAVKIDDGLVFASAAGSQLFAAASGSLELVQTIETGEGARTMGVDPTTHRIYLPSATYEAVADGKRVAKPNSFVMLVVGRN